MNRSRLNDISGLLTGLLREERALLRQGRARETVELLEEKLRLLDSFDAALAARSDGRFTDQELSDIQEIQRLADDNSKHFVSIRNGMRNMIARLHALGVDSDVGTYDRRGVSVPFSGTTGGYIKRV